MSADLLNGEGMHALMTRLFPICRSLSGPGNRETLNILSEHLPIDQIEIPSGSEVFDWTVPNEWSIREAWVENSEGHRVIDFAEHNLHVVGYSIPVDQVMSFDELRPHLHSLPEQPDAIPYVTFYYKRDWGFCLRHQDLEAMSKTNTYTVRIDSTLAPGNITLGECIIPGDTDEEILLSTNICHPSMANNELSGPVMLSAIGQWLQNRKYRRYTYRLLFLPETIGAIAYLANNAEHMKSKTVAGYQVVCVGGPDHFSMIQSRRENTLSDRMAINALSHSGHSFKILDYTHRASDERQYNSPGIDIPVAVLSKSLFLDYDAYHTSLDDLDYVTPENMAASLKLYTSLLTGLENNRRYRVTIQGGEPQLGPRGLYPQAGGGRHYFDEISEFLAYADGENDVLDIAERHGRSVSDYASAISVLTEAGLIEATN